jgi:4-aminobutyrate aminotransferase
MGPLPNLRTAIPGPRSRELAARLRRVECPTVTFVSPGWPIFWEAAAGANVQDVDGNVYLDATSAFGVASVGHANPAVVDAIRRQAGRLLHGMGDVHPSEGKVRLAEKLAEITPGDLQQTIFSSSGTEAVESALKTAAIHTGRAGVIAFHGAYHGLGPGALNATARKAFRRPFGGLLGRGFVHLPFPTTAEAGARVLEEIEQTVAHPDTAGEDVGAVLIEPIQGRGGVNVAPDEFLRGLRALCDRHKLVLIADEVFTGFCRTGRWFAVDHAGIVPDLMCLGKGMAGGMPISACIGRAAVMQSWPESTGEALHTSTFLGHPAGCAAALAALGEMERGGLAARAAELGAALMELLRPLRARFPAIHELRGCGLMIGVELRGAGVDPTASGAKLAAAVAAAALRRGLLLLIEGSCSNVAAFTPPLVITPEQLAAAAAIFADSLTECGA